MPRSGAPLRCTPWHRSSSYDVRRVAGDHPDFIRNALRAEDLSIDSLNLDFAENQCAIGAPETE